MTPGDKFLQTVQGIPDGTSKEERIRIFLQAQLDFADELEAIRKPFRQPQE